MLKPAGVAESTNEAVVCFYMRWIGCNGGTKGLCGFCGGAGCEQVQSTFGERFGGGFVGDGHGFL